MDLWSIYFVYGGASGMVAAIVVVIWRFKSIRVLTLKSLLWLLYVLAAMAVMFGVAAYYLANPSTSNLFNAILISNVSMVAWLLFLSGNTGNDRLVDRRLSAVAIAIGVLVGEILMGITYTLYFSGAIKDLLLASLNSPWFIVPMTAEAGISYIVSRRGDGLLSRVAPLWIANMLFNPIMLGGDWFYISLAASAAIMTVIIITMLDYLHKHKVVHDHDMYVFVGASAVMAVMMVMQLLAYIGLIPWALYGIAVLVDMAWYLMVYLNDEPGKPISWLTKPVTLALTLTAIFVAEATMGGVISIEAGWLNAAALRSLISPVSLIGLIKFISALSLGPGFMIMMGIEMGWLVITRITELRNLENRVRIILMVVAYAIYSVYIPSFLPAGLVKYPYLDWSMGLGTAGSLAPSLLIAVLGTYAINGVLSFLFGSRQVCSLMCSAAYMWQGTFYDDLKLVRLHAGRRQVPRGIIRRVHDVAMALIMPLLIVLAVISYMDQVGYLHITAWGVDPLVLLYLVSFGVVWYIMFALSPILGTYNCVTYGWCHWGVFNQLVSRIGFFKLVAKDPSACVTCRSKACALACPVGNTGMPGSFIAKGYYKSITCVGVGDCVEACPYNNIEIWDVRHSFRQLLHRLRDMSPRGLIH